MQTLSQCPSKVQSKRSEIHTISKVEGVVATLTDPTRQSRTTVHVEHLSACSHRIRDELDVPDSVPHSNSVSGACLQESVHDDPMSSVASVDPAKQTRALGKRVPKSTRRTDYIYLIYTCRAMGQLLAKQSSLQATAPMGAPLNEY